MKKLFPRLVSAVLALVMVASMLVCIPLTTSAATVKAYSYDEFSIAGNKATYGKGTSNPSVTLPALDITAGQSVGLRGWIGFDTAIVDFGYLFDGNAATCVWGGGAYNEPTENLVLTIGGANAKRFWIQADTTNLSDGAHTITFYALFSGGSVHALDTFNLNVTGAGSPAPAVTSKYLNLLSEDMQPILAGNTGTVYEETIMLVKGKNTKNLLYPISSVQEVKYINPTTGAVTYFTNGVDYSVNANGQFVIIENSALYNLGIDATTYATQVNGVCGVYWGENEPMTQHQVRISYTTNGSGWSTTYEQASYYDSAYAGFLNKLKAGQDVTMLFHGDSITYGACATFIARKQPMDGYNYTMLLAMALADLFDYKVSFVQSHNYAASTDGSLPYVPMPATYIPATGGNRGTITHVNTAVGGWTSQDGVEKYQTHIADYISRYGCDFFTIAYGANDVSIPTATTVSNISTVVGAVKAAYPNAAVAIIASMLPCPTFYGGTSYVKAQAPALSALTSTYSNTALVNMTTISDAFLSKKGDFGDFTGNNVNHPNDFFYRVYAQTMLEAIIGYENLDTVLSGTVTAPDSPTGGGTSGGGNGGSSGEFVAPEDNSVANTSTSVDHQTSCDGVAIDGVWQNTLDQYIASDWLVDNQYTITDTTASYNTLSFYGWTNTGSNNIAGFGYEINNQIVWVNQATYTYTHSTYTFGAGSTNAGQVSNGIAPDMGLSGHFPYAKRALVEINVADLPAGVYNINILVKLTDGTVNAIQKWGTIKYVKYGPAIENKLTGASVSVGESLALNVYTTIADPSSNDWAVRFTINDKVTLVPFSQAVASGNYGEYIFTFTNMTPQSMSDLIDIELVQYNTATNEVTTSYDSKIGYSIKTNLSNTLNDSRYNSDAQLVQLIHDLLTYGAVAQTYTRHNIDQLITDGLTLTPSTAIPSSTTDGAQFNLTTSQSENTKFSGATVLFDFGFNRMVFKYKADAGKTVTITVNGVDVTASAEFDTTKAVYSVTSDPMTILGNDSAYEVCLYENGTLVQTLSYSVNAYAYRLYQAANPDALTVDEQLALALYRYGVSAEAYVASH